MAKLDPTQVRYVNLHRSAIRALLALESRSKAALARALRREVAVAREEVLTALEAAGDPRAKAAAAVAAARRVAAGMAVSVARDVLDVRAQARAVAAQQHQAQMRLVFRLAKRDGYSVSDGAERRIAQVYPRHVVSIGGLGDGGRAIDSAAADLAGRAVADKFLRHTMAGAIDWQSTGLVGADLTKWIQETRAHVEKQAAQMAVLHTAPAYADEIDKQIHEFFTTEFGEEEWTGNVFRVWSATLDRVTCPRCWERDGQMLPAKEQFSPPPGMMHPFCRCEELTLYVPDAIRRKLPGLQSDYRRMKEEFAEDLPGNAPAAEYIAGALGATQSGNVIRGGNPKASTSEYMTRRMKD